MLVCKFCSKECKNLNSSRNHERLCPQNKDRNYVSQTAGKPAWNSGLTKESDSRVAKGADSLKSNMTPRHGMGKTEELELLRCQKISTTLKKSGKSGGYRENAGRSKKFSVYDSYGKRTTLQSSYEHAVFEILTELGIRWIRPTALKYDGKNYFADFYLIDYDIYLDPKNHYKAKCDFQKIEMVKRENSVKVYIILKEQINKFFIGKLAEMD